jgi:uncharacterized membrane protein YesL
MNISSGLYKLFDRIYRLALINILWLFFSIIGLIIFGFFPATVAMFTIIRKSVLKEDVPIFRTFWLTYKKEFFKSNLLGLILVVIGYIFYLDLIFLKSTSGLIQFLYAPMLVMSFVYMLMLLYIFPVYVHYEVKVVQIIKNSFLLMVLYPIYTIMMMMMILLVSFMMLKWSSSIIFFSGSLISFIIMGCSNLAFQKNAQKLQKSTKSNHVPS